MKILVIGGTGTMGGPLVELLEQDGENQVSYISRMGGGIGKARHLMGNALDETFMDKVLMGEGDKFDCIVDFMWYTAAGFQYRFEKLLRATNHYIGLSSGAVCADADQPITEDMPRMIDICTRREREKSHEYHLEKARIEDILKASAYHNWTLIRPHVTFNSNRLPLFVWEKEQWLYRALSGHTIILTRDMLNKRTVLTYGRDMAKAIIRLIGNRDAFGEVINITSKEHIQREVLINTYKEVLEETCGIDMKVLYLNNVDSLRKAFPGKKDRIDNDRMLNRVYDISKFLKIAGEDFPFSDWKSAISICINECIRQTDLKQIKLDPLFSAYMDRIAGERTAISFFDGYNKLLYTFGMIVPSYEMYAWIIYKLNGMKLACKRVIKRIILKT